MPRSDGVASTRTGPVNSFHLASASEDENQNRLDQAGGPTRTAADLAQDAPALELGVRPLPGTTLASVSGVVRRAWLDTVIPAG